MAPAGTPSVAVLGECMLELSPVAAAPGQYRLGVAGDTFNTATGLSQLGVATEYLTGLGEDRYSDHIAAEGSASGVGMQHVARLPGHQPGLYLIDNAPDGERQFSYWRETSAARVTLQNARSLLRLLDTAAGADCLYLSGISLALCGDDGRDALWPWLDTYRAAGGRAIYDANYRPALWSSPGAAAESHRQMTQRADIYLSGIEDELALRGGGERAALLAELADLANRETVLKEGAAGVTLIDEQGNRSVPGKTVAQVVDTSGAGDAFNAGYLAGRLQGLDRVAASRFGCRVAAATVGVSGARLPAAQWQLLRRELRELLQQAAR